jgi:hypothetical protein
MFMKYHSGKMISLGDRVTYNGQEGCIALIGGEVGSGSALIKQEEWNLNDEQLFVFFDNGARLILDGAQDDELLALVARSG